MKIRASELPDYIAPGYLGVRIATIRGQLESCHARLLKEGGVVLHGFIKVNGAYLASSAIVAPETLVELIDISQSRNN